ncbi:hypothetical protein A8M60_01780 [Nocardia farcinica]|nr:hypothetical protein A8M60_01780 [Nocardia farcinica]
MTTSAHLSPSTRRMAEQNAKVIRQMMPTVPLARFGLAQVTPRPFASLDYGQVTALEATQQRLASSLRGLTSSLATLEQFWSSLIERRQVAGVACSEFLQQLRVRGPESFTDRLNAVQTACEHSARLFAIYVALAIKTLLQHRNSRPRAPGHDVAAQPRVVRGPTPHEVFKPITLVGPCIVRSAA